MHSSFVRLSSPDPQVEMLQSVDGAQSIDTSNLATPAALEVPGKKNGEVLVVAVPGRGAIAYSWNQEEHQVSHHCTRARNQCHPLARKP